MTTAHAAPQAAGTGPRALEGRVALVTGGTRGIGAAISRSLGQAGAIVAAGYTRDDEAAARFIKDIDVSDDRQGTVHRGNVGNPEDCERVVQEVIEKHGRLDILINNAGITSDKPVLKMSFEDWDKVIRVNLSGAFYMAKPALQHMVDRGSGRIVNISSIIGQQGNIGQANYASSKSGMFGLTMTLAREAAHALKKAGKARGRPRPHGQHRRAGLRQHRHGRDGAGEGPRRHPGQDPPGPPRGAGRDRARRALPLRRRLLLHHRPGLGGQRRHGDVAGWG